MAASTAARDAGLTPFAPVRTRETVALGGDLAALSELVGGTVRAKVAILWDWESFWAKDLEWRPSADPGHRRQIETSYNRLGNDGITTDFAHPESDLSRDEVVLEGATAVVGYRTGASARRPAVTRNRFGAGTAWHLSTEFDSEQLSTVLGDAMLEAGLAPRLRAGNGLGVVERRSADTIFTIAINHGEHDVTTSRPPGSRPSFWHPARSRSRAGRSKRSVPDP